MNEKTNQTRTQFIDNLFSANQRNAMIEKYGWTDAMSKEFFEELCFQAYRPESKELVF